MELLLLIIYSTIVWLIFFKFKWLPWTIVSQVIVITIPIIGLTVLILTLNLVAPSTNDVRVINYVVQVVPRVTGRVTEVPVEPNRLVKKGQVLFRIDPVPFQNAVKQLEAKLVEARAKLNEAAAKLSESSAGARELRENLKAATAQVGVNTAKLELAQKRVVQYRELVASSAGNRFDLESAVTESQQLQSQIASARANEAQVIQKLSAQVGGEQAQVAAARAQLAASNAQIASVEAQLADARWQLGETTVYAPADGYAVNLQLRPGSTASQFAGLPVMSFVETGQWLIAMYSQNELRRIEPGNEAEIALKTYPNRIIKCKVDSVVWATGQGQLPISGSLPQTGVAPVPPGRFAVKLAVEERDQDVFLAAGAVGIGAVYTDSLEFLHIIRKVFIRVSTKLDALILKLH
ncbi:MAG: HlyD family secretion protein [Burkholderiales bacterium]